jgi:hypothetical protein
MVRRLPAACAVALLVSALSACSSIGPPTVPRDRADYGASIGDSWKEQTLLNIIRLRYADFPVFLEVAQVIAGYQLQTTVGAGVLAQNYLSSAVNVPAAVAGTAAVGATYIDRPTIIYAPLTGNDFIKKLLTPIPPSAVLFLLQSGYPASVVMSSTVDSINGLANEVRRGAMKRPADPRFVRLNQLLQELQVANAFQVQIERSKDKETTVLGFPSMDKRSDFAAQVAEIRQLLGISGTAPVNRVVYGGYSGKGDEIAMVTRSMLQLMLEIGALAQVPEADIATGKAGPGMGRTSEQSPLLNILSGEARPRDAFVAVPYKGRWFWISDSDHRSKTIFISVMLLFSVSDVGVRTNPAVVTVPAN